MTSGGDRLVMGASQRAGTQPVFQTWCSASAELASSHFPPVAKAPPRLHGMRGKKDRALFPAVRAAFKSLKLPEPLLDVLAIAVAVVFGLSGAAALVVGFAMALFAKF